MTSVGLKIRSLLVAAVILLMSFFSGCEKVEASASVRSAPEVNAVRFDVLGDDVMPIGCWWAPYDASDVTINGTASPDWVSDEYFGLLRDSGINFISHSNDLFPDDRASISKMLDLCEKYGIGYFVKDTRLKEIADPQLLEMLTFSYLRKEYCLGIHLGDEPEGSEIESFKSIYDTFAKTIYSKNKYLYVNLFPSYAGGESLSGSHRSYVERFANATGASFISYDNYPFLKADTGVTENLPPTYFKDLSTLRSVANEYGVPFWTFVQTGGQWEEYIGKSSAPLFPSKAETLWNVNTCLAYGAKAIQYFTFMQPLFFADAGGGNYDFGRNGMIGADGRKTQWYDYVKQANAQIAATDHVLMSSRQAGVLACGYWENRLPISDKPGGAFVKAWRELIGISSESSDGAIVGCFDYVFETDKCKSAFYVVNCDVYSRQNITLDFDAIYDFEITIDGTYSEASGGKLSVALEPGSSALVVLK